MKEFIFLAAFALASPLLYAGDVDDFWDPGDDMGPPDCGGADGAQGHAGNPIHVGMGNKFEETVVYEGIGTNPLRFAWNYNSELLGSLAWRYNLQAAVETKPAGNNTYDLQHYTGDGRYTYIDFDTPIPSVTSCPNPTSTVTYEQITPGYLHKISGVTQRDDNANCETLISSHYGNPNGQSESFEHGTNLYWNNAYAAPTHIDFPNGERHTYQFDPATLQLLVQHSNGQSMVVQFETKVVEDGSTAYFPSQLSVGSLQWNFVYQTFAVDGSNKAHVLEKITGPGSTESRFEYQTQVISANLPTPVLKVMLTDRYLNGAHVAGWVYSQENRAYRSYHGPNSSSQYTGADFFDGTQFGAIEIIDVGANSLDVIDEFGRTTSYGYDAYWGYDGSKKSKLDSVYGSATTNCLGTSTTRTYDSYWRLDTFTDASFTQHQRTYTSGTGSRGRTHKLKSAIGTGEDRTVTFEYADEDKNLISKRIQSGLTTEYDYYSNGRLKEARVVDTTSHSKPYATNGQSQRTTYTYEYYDLDERQLKKITVDGPRTDVTDITTLDYDLLGRLVASTNAVGHVTTFSNFNAWGLPQTIDKSGLITTLGYKAGASKPLLESIQIGNQSPLTTTYNSYELAETVTYPSGASFTYHYKTIDPESLYLIENQLGERLSLDRAVDRDTQITTFTRSTFADSQTTTASYHMVKLYDAIGRLYQTTNSLGGVTEHNYNEKDLLTTTNQNANDGDGNPTNIFASYDYDFRDRLISHYENYAGTNFLYNSLDELKSVEDALLRKTTYVKDAFGNAIQIVSRDSGKTIQYFDNANNLVSVTDAESITKIYTYDELNRLKTIQYPGSPSENISLSYDGTLPNQHGIGRLTQISGPGGVTTLYYDFEGHVVKEVWMFLGQTYITEYAYTNELLTSMTYPSGRTVVYRYDGLGRVNEVEWQEGATTHLLASNVIYKPFGPLSSYQYGNGITHSIGHDINYRVTNITSGSALNLSYDYDGFERITSILDTLNTNNSQTLRYDVHNRLENAQGSYGYREYFYDDIGNRSDLVVDGEQYSYWYNSAGKLQRVYDETRFKNLKRFTYRKNGDAKTAGSTQLSMNHADQVGSVTTPSGTISYKYSLTNQRVYKSGVEVVYHYDQQGNLLAESDANTGQTIREYYYLNGGLVSTLPVSGSAGQLANLQYVHLNHINTPVKLTDMFGSVVWSAHHMPFGEATLDVELTTFNIRFPGQYFDAETGLHYNWNRYYDPNTGRYLQSDPIGLKGGINTYAYVGSNPSSYVDPFGLRTTVIITYDYGVGSHAAVHTTNGNSGGPFLYDPAGSYQPTGGGRGTGDFFVGDAANLADYIQYQESTGSTVETHTLDTTPRQEQAIADQAIDTGGAAPFFCAAAVSSALGGICGEEGSMLPDTLGENIDNASQLCR